MEHDLQNHHRVTLSILIPTYNFSARALVHELHTLAATENVEAEIIIGDDASTDDMGWLYEVQTLPGVRLWSTAVNLGRAHICNALARAARGQWLLIVDADARVPDDFSLRRYLDDTRQAPVVCGGLRHPEVNPCPEATLRYKYERAADRHRSAAERQQRPYMQLSTFNLLVQRDIFMGIGFDEQCTDYGYEDALFGVELLERGIGILHTDNALDHMGLEPNAVYLHKTETALHTLRGLNGRMHGHSRVENVANGLRRWQLAWLVRAIYCFTRPILRWNLLGKHPSLRVFAFYKLGYYLSLK